MTSSMLEQHSADAPPLAPVRPRPMPTPADCPRLATAPVPETPDVGETADAWGPGYSHPKRLPQTRTITERHARTPRRTVEDVLARRAQLATVHGECEVRLTDEAVRFIVPLGAADLAHLRAEVEGA